MAISVQTNIAAITALKNLNINNANMNASLTKLSTGFRINSAADDASGFAIASKLDAQTMRLKAAALNATQAQAMTKTADAGVNEIQNMVSRIQVLATQASSANNAGELAKLDAERIKLEGAIDKIANGTNYNGINLLNGLDAATAAAVTQIAATVNTGAVTQASGVATSYTVSATVTNNVVSGVSAAAGTVTDQTANAVNATVSAATNAGTASAAKMTVTAAALSPATGVAGSTAVGTVSTVTTAGSTVTNTVTTFAAGSITQANGSTVTSSGSMLLGISYTTPVFASDGTGQLSVKAINNSGGIQVFSTTNIYDSNGATVLAANLWTATTTSAFAGKTGLTLTSTGALAGDVAIIDINSAGTRKTAMVATFTATGTILFTSDGNASLTLTSTGAGNTSSNTVTSDRNLYSATGVTIVTAGVSMNVATFNTATGITIAATTAALAANETSTIALNSAGVQAKTLVASSGTTALITVAAAGGSPATLSVIQVGNTQVVQSNKVLYNTANSTLAIQANTNYSIADFNAATGMNIAVSAAGISTGESVTLAMATSGTAFGTQKASLNATGADFVVTANTTITVTSTDGTGGANVTVTGGDYLVGSTGKVAVTAGTTMTLAAFNAAQDSGGVALGLTINLDSYALAAGETTTFTAGVGSAPASAIAKTQAVVVTGSANFYATAAASFSVVANSTAANDTTITVTGELLNKATGAQLVSTGTTMSQTTFASLTGLTVSTGSSGVGAAALASGETSTFVLSSNGSVAKALVATVTNTANATALSTSDGLNATFTVTSTDTAGGYSVTSNKNLVDATGTVVVTAGTTAMGSGTGAGSFSTLTGMRVTTNNAISVGETSTFSTTAAGQLADTMQVGVAVSGGSVLFASATAATFTATSTGTSATSINVSSNVNLTDNAGNVVVTGGATMTKTAFQAATGLTLTLNANAVKSGEVATFATSATGTEFRAAGAVSGYTQPVTFQVGANNSVNDQVTLNLTNSYTATALGLAGTAAGSLTSATNALAYIQTSKDALNQLITQRADLGATQNQVGFILSNLATSIEQTRASVSAIKDADMAAQMAEFTKNKILTQAGTAMLAQANQAAQNILTLFR